MDDEQECPECEAMAGWVMTFADLMSLLMCFFVLLLAFSEMDVLKYKQVAGSMKFAFGVQREIKADDIPKGTSIIAQEFSPGEPKPTPVNQVRQITTDEYKQNLDFSDTKEKHNQSSADTTLDQAKRKLEDEAEKKAEEVRKALKKEIEEGIVEVIKDRDQVVIRIREKGSFDSGKAIIQPGFYPVMQRVAKALNSVSGKIIVAGHTDNVPIRTLQFPSNWVLSAARAANVVHFMTVRGGVEPERMEIRAHADVSPVTENDSFEGRAKNRRVEIVIHGDAETSAALGEDQEPVGEPLPEGGQ